MNNDQLPLFPVQPLKTVREFIREGFADRQARREEPRAAARERYARRKARKTQANATPPICAGELIPCPHCGGHGSIWIPF